LQGPRQQSPPRLKSQSSSGNSDFLSVDDQFKPKVVYSATAFAKGGKPRASVVDIEGTEKVVPRVIDDCTKEPGASFWQKLKGEWDNVEREAKKL